MKTTALLVALAIMTTTEARGYETDDFGFPVAQSASSRSTTSYNRARRTRSFRVVRTASPRYCPPATSVAVRAEAQPTVAATTSRVQAQVVSTTKQPAAAPSSKTTLSATQAKVVQPKS